MADNDVNTRVSLSHVTSGKTGFATIGSARAVNSSQLCIIILSIVQTEKLDVTLKSAC
jgi:hypothetical protein